VVGFESEKETSFRGEYSCSKQTHVEAYALQVDAILECGSLTGLTFLAVKSTRDRKQKIAVVCAGWVLINIVRPVTQENPFIHVHTEQAAQVGVAMIGFTYALNNAVDYNSSVIGDILFTDMSQSFAYSIDYDTRPASELAAHTVGFIPSKL